jgi:hypothetical protein
VGTDDGAPLHARIVKIVKEYVQISVCMTENTAKILKETFRCSKMNKTRQTVTTNQIASDLN